MSAHRRFLMAPGAITGNEAELKGALARQIGRVLRLRDGDSIVLLDGSGTEYDARIVSIDRDSVRVTIEGSRRCGLDPTVELALAVCMPKADKLELVVQKCTELGISELIALESERTVSRPAPERLREKMRRWSRIAAEAAEQCGRGSAPRVERFVRFDELAGVIGEFDLALVAWEEERQTAIREVLRQYSRGGPILLIIGPEGGLTEREVEVARAAGASSVSLGSRVLRVDTAAIAATAIVMYELDTAGAGIGCGEGNSELEADRQALGVQDIQDGSDQ